MSFASVFRASESIEGRRFGLRMQGLTSKPLTGSDLRFGFRGILRGPGDLVSRLYK